MMSNPPVPQQVVPTHHQIRVELFSFEKGCLEAYLENAIESIKRSHPNAAFPPFKMLSFHRLLEFQSASAQCTSAPAYGFFKLKIKLIQRSQPKPELFFVCSFPKASEYFPGCSQFMADFQPPEVLDTVLNLTTTNGRLVTPPVSQLTQENLVVLKMFSINILMENLSFSTPPFEQWRPVEVARGFLSFPQHQSLLAPLPDHQQPMAEQQYRYQPPYQHSNPVRTRPAPTFNVPPPTHQYGRNGSWTAQNSSWDTIPFNPHDPHLAHLPFPRQQPRVHGSSVNYNRPSKEEFLESFRQSQRKMKEAEQQYLTTTLQDIASSRTGSENGSTSSQPDQQANTSNTVQAEVHVVDRDQSSNH